MAEQNPHDVVTKALSVDDPSLTDVSATQNFDSVAHAAAEKQTAVHSHSINPIDHDLTPIEQPADKVGSSDQANVHESEVSNTVFCWLKNGINNKGRCE